MGILSWFFPSEADRIAKARRLMSSKRWAEARMEILDIESTEAQELITTTELALAEINISQAVALTRQGDDDRADHHISLAKEFGRGRFDEEISAARKEMREIRQSEKEAAEKAAAAHDAKLFEIHPDFASAEPQIPLPDGVSDAAADEMRARVSLVYDNYPESLRESMVGLGPQFVRAVLDLDEGKPESAVQVLMGLPDDSALVNYERARAAHVLGDPKAAARAVVAFAELAKGHHSIGRTHTGVWLAQLHAETGDVDSALAVLRQVRKKDKDAGGFLFAQLLEATGDLKSAEKVIAGLIRNHPGEMPLYTMLARVRSEGGLRVQAMQVLEQGLRANPCTPGKCGNKQPDLGAHRMLAILYLEDGIETDRAIQLADTARGLIQKPGWDDLYMEALRAKAEQEMDAPELVKALLGATPEGDPRRPRLERYLGST